MLLREFKSIVNEVVPLGAAVTADPIGLQIESRSGRVQSILVCLEVTDLVVAEAIQGGHDTIVTFHPLVYSPLSNIDRSNRVARCVADCIAADISVFCVHTAFDAHPQGTNNLLAHRLEAPVIGTLADKCGDSEILGLLLQWDATFEDLVQKVSEVCGSPVRFSNAPTENPRVVAVVAGSGMSFMDHAIASGADVLITADVKYHGFHAASGVIGLIDPGHYEMEQFVPDGIAALLRPALNNTTIAVSSVDTNPVRYASPLPLKSPVLSHL